ncbi:MAG: hypothetical protein EOP84_20455 [Verrucomicrobiaceae bacterium]|nr:MAG: hypothetical protein EOP84_20455 [Verrucomicrobiaceae bacterium]
MSVTKLLSAIFSTSWRDRQGSEDADLSGLTYVKKCVEWWKSPHVGLLASMAHQGFIMRWSKADRLAKQQERSEAERQERLRDDILRALKSLDEPPTL